ncbi:hypothetical protein [Marinobacter sp.]|uniref:hypothetical protein n=1 Tax=Marinobacter sp. TaxID=50741 RepID=UPI00384E54E5
MKFSFRTLFFRASVLALAIIGLSGCASYYSHYGVFPAANSQNEPRKVRVTWQTAEYPGWWIQDSRATAVTVETQCSSRVWQLTDGSQDDSASGNGCGGGIRACAEPGMDVMPGSTEPAPADHACMTMTDSQGTERIVDLDRQVSLTVSCKPASPVQQSGDDTKNYDYLRASVVPYEFQVRKAPRGSLVARPPSLSDRVCD